MTFKQNTPIYIQIADRIMDEILSGIYAEDERIPSVREYGMTLEVNVNTMVKVYDLLTQNNLIYNRRGLGYFVCKGAQNHIRDMRRKNFFNEFLPQLAEQIKQLEISRQDFENELQKYLQS